MTDGPPLIHNLSLSGAQSFIICLETNFKTPMVVAAVQKPTEAVYSFPHAKNTTFKTSYVLKQRFWFGLVFKKSACIKMTPTGDQTVL